MEKDFLTASSTLVKFIREWLPHTKGALAAVVHLL
jgi:hypothetical protein